MTTGLFTHPVYAYDGSLNVKISSNGGGAITSSLGSCSDDCTYTQPEGTTVTLTATPSNGRHFLYWQSSDCVGANGGYTASATCDVTFASASRFARAYFAYNTYTIAAQKVGTGSGTVSNTGQHAYSQSTPVVLTATASAGSVFSGWQVTGADSCFGYAGVGKSGNPIVSTTPTCEVRPSSYTTNTYTAVAKFDLAPSSTPTASSTPKPTATPSPSPTSTPATIEAPDAAKVTINGQTVQDSSLSFPSNKAITIVGQAAPNATVKLYIFSTPQEATVTADANGTWAYTIHDLEAGSHHVEAEVVDATTKAASARVTLASFTVSAQATSAPAATAKSAPLWVWVIGALALICALGGGTWLWVKQRRARTHAEQKINPTMH